MPIAPYKLKVLIRICLILITGFAGIYILMQTPFWMSSIWLFIAAIIAIVELFAYLTRTQKELDEFLLAIGQEDFSNMPPAKESREERIAIYNAILEKFRILRKQNEIEHQYLLYLLEHIQVAIICFDAHEHVRLINKAAMNLLQIPRIQSLQPLKKRNQELYAAIKDMNSGRQAVLNHRKGNRTIELSLRATEFKLEEQKYILVSLQDISTELEEKEIETWQKLVQVLTHEIMNSAIPITNLAGMAGQKMENGEGNLVPSALLDAEAMEDIHGSLKTIESRTRGLVNFVKATKSLTNISKPQVRTIVLNELFERLSYLFRSKFNELKIDFQKKIEPPDLCLAADLELIEQVLINLIQNAIEAMQQTQHPELILNACRKEDGSTVLSITDNGSGIKDEQLEKIFVPFYSTKSNGSGIGLSLSRQIMHLHHASMEVSSIPGKGSTFSLVF